MWILIHQGEHVAACVVLLIPEETLLGNRACMYYSIHYVPVCRVVNMEEPASKTHATTCPV